DVQNHSLKERLRLVKEEFGPRPPQLLWNRSGKVVVIFSDDPVEFGNIIVEVSGRQISIYDSRIRHFPGSNGIKKCVRHMPPAVVVGLTTRIRDSVHISSLTEDLVAFSEPQNTE